MSEISLVKFQQAVKLAIDNGLSIYDLAAKIESAPGTITRWANGHTAPLPIFREEILRTIVKMQKDNK